MSRGHKALSTFRRFVSCVSPKCFGCLIYRGILFSGGRSLGSSRSKMQGIYINWYHSHTSHIKCCVGVCPCLPTIAMASSKNLSLTCCIPKYGVTPHFRTASHMSKSLPTEQKHSSVDLTQIRSVEPFDYYPLGLLKTARLPSTWIGTRTGWALSAQALPPATSLPRRVAAGAAGSIRPTATGLLPQSPRLDTGVPRGRDQVGGFR